VYLPGQIQIYKVHVPSASKYMNIGMRSVEMLKNDPRLDCQSLKIASDPLHAAVLVQKSVHEPLAATDCFEKKAPNPKGRFPSYDWYDRKAEVLPGRPCMSKPLCK